MNAFKIALIAVAAATLTVVGLTNEPVSRAEAGGHCHCSVSWRVRPCRTGDMFKMSSSCRRRATSIKVETAKGLRLASPSSCRKRCERFGRATVHRIQRSTICRARPNQQIAMVWRGRHGGRTLFHTRRRAGGADRFASCTPPRRR